MIALLVSGFLAIVLWSSEYHYDVQAGGVAIRTVMITTSFLFLFFVPIGSMFAWGPLQRAEHDLTPRILEMFRKDGKIRLESVYMTIFSLFSLIAATDPIFAHLAIHDWFFPLWIILFGGAIDCLHHYGLRILNYLNPATVITMLGAQARHCVEVNRELDFCGWVDSLTEVAIKGVQRYSPSVANLVIQEEQELARLFLGASKSIGHPSEDPQMKAAGIKDKVSFTMFYLYQRFDTIFDKALKAGMEPTCMLILTSMGKVSVAAAEYDMSIAAAPIRFLGKYAKAVQDNGMQEATMTASCVFSEVAKAITNNVDLTYYEIKDAFLSLINGMEILAKDSFRKNKEMNIGLLAQPFKELRDLFLTDKMQNHQDTPVIMQNIDRVLGEFEALLVVMKTIPSIPKE